MTCPICDKKPMNCDCTLEERQMHAEIEDLQGEVTRLRGSLMLTEDERAAVEACVKFAFPASHPTATTLRNLLERTK